MACRLLKYGNDHGPFFFGDGSGMKLYQLFCCLLPAALMSAPVSAEPWVAQQPKPTPGIARCADPVTARLQPNEARYDICGDQFAQFNKALDRARASKRLLLVEFGATWCPSCRALQKQLRSADILQSTTDNLDYAAAFELVEIGVSTMQSGRVTEVPDGQAILAQVLASAKGAKMKSVPFLAVIDPSDNSRTITRNLDDLERPAGGHQAEGIRVFLRAAHAHIDGNGAAPVEPGWLAAKFNRGWQRLFGG